MGPLYDDAGDLVRVLVAGVLAYAGLVLVLRISGKRTLAKLNAFDLVVTIAFGSALSSALLTESVSVAEGLLAFVVLAALQWAVARATLRWPLAQQAARSRPRALVVRGALAHDALADERVTEAAVRQAIRQQGCWTLGEVEAVILETDGSLSVLVGAPGEDTWALADVDGWPRASADDDDRWPPTGSAQLAAQPHTVDPREVGGHDGEIDARVSHPPQRGVAIGDGDHAEARFPEQTVDRASRCGVRVDGWPSAGPAAG